MHISNVSSCPKICPLPPHPNFFSCPTLEMWLASCLTPVSFLFSLLPFPLFLLIFFLSTKALLKSVISVTPLRTTTRWVAIWDQFLVQKFHPKLVHDALSPSVDRKSGYRRRLVRVMLAEDLVRYRNCISLWTVSGQRSDDLWRQTIIETVVV